MNAVFTINRKYGNIDRAKPQATTQPKRQPRHRRRRLGHALGYFNGGNALRFYFNIIFK